MSSSLQTIILWVMHFIPGLRLRVSEKVEAVGIDEVEMGEFAYDYVGVDPDLNGHFSGADQAQMEMKPMTAKTPDQEVNYGGLDKHRNSANSMA
jgi:ammonium transporter, Amt family